MKKIVLSITVSLISMTVLSQEVSLKQQSLEAFKLEHYDDAIHLI